MKKIFTLLLTFSILFCFFACEKGEKTKEKSIYEVYSEAMELTADLSYQKFNITYETLDIKENTSLYSKGPIFCKLIKEDGKISFYSERTIRVTSGEITITPTFYHNYIDGVMYQTLESQKMKHTLSAEEFEEKYPGFQDIMICFSEDALLYPASAESANGGISYSLDEKFISRSEMDKMYHLFDLCSEYKFDGDYEINGITIYIETDFDGYFTCYNLSFLANGSSDGEQKSICMNISLDILNPGSHFVMNPIVGNKNDYTDGSFEIK